MNFNPTAKVVFFDGQHTPYVGSITAEVNRGTAASFMSISYEHDEYWFYNKKFFSSKLNGFEQKKTRNFCCFFIAYSAFPNLKTYGKISQNLKGSFLEMKKALKKTFRGTCPSIFNTLAKKR